MSADRSFVCAFTCMLAGILEQYKTKKKQYKTKKKQYNTIQTVIILTLGTYTECELDSAPNWIFWVRPYLNWKYGPEARTELNLNWKYGPEARTELNLNSQFT